MASMDPAGPARGAEGRSRPGWLIPVVIILAALLAIGAVYLTRSDDSEQAAQEQTAAGEGEDRAAVEHPDSVAAPDLSSEETRDPEDLVAEGPVDAPVVLVMFTDFQCPYCAQWSHESLPVMREYVDRGELRIEWRDVNVYGDDSERAARAVVAASMQDQFEAYHDTLFEGGQIRSPGELSEPALIEAAAELGMDAEQFEQDMNSPEVQDIVDANAQQGIDIGAMSTPAFIIAGTPTIGAQPTEHFTQLVDEALADAEG